MTEMVARVSVPTEARNPRTLAIDIGTTLSMLELLNGEDARVAGEVERVLPALAEAVDLAAERIRSGGRVHYFGAGTSGRLAVLDAVELLPTFNADPDLVVAHHAGGEEALISASEDAEDSEELGAADAAGLSSQDLVVGIAASGRTPYVAGALRGARERGAATVLVSCNPAAPLAELADIHIAPETGPEAIAGSTRLKAGTATKLVLNAFSTALMVRLGRTYSNLMVSVVATNSKLRGRLITILCEATAEPEERARAALQASDGDLKTALVSLLGDCSPERARAALNAAGGVVRVALDELAGGARHIGVRAAVTRASQLVVGLDAGGSGSRIRLASTDGSGRATDRT
jgi:N-acetylmuramic acid 6-phosphate etherase